MNERTHTNESNVSDTRWTIQRCVSFSFSPDRSVSLRGDINCLLPNLIRNFRRRGNLTSFLFSLARSRARCWRGSRSQDFSIHDRSRADSDQTTGHPRFNVINLYRCVTCSALSLSLSHSFFLSFCLFLRLTSSSFDVVWSRRAKNREYERARDGVTLNCRREEQRWKGIVRKRDVGMPSTLSHFRSPCYRFIKVTMITRELRRPLYLIVPIQRRPKTQRKKRTFSLINREPKNFRSGFGGCSEWSDSVGVSGGSTILGFSWLELVVDRSLEMFLQLPLVSFYIVRYILYTLLLHFSFTF